MISLIPREVEHWFNQLKCPVCKGPVICGEDPIFYDDLYWVGGYCRMKDEYSVGCSFSDPRIIRLEDEEITFEFDDFEFQINKQISRTKDTTYNYITITGIYSGELDEYFQINGDYFDFRHFDPEQFAQRIQTLRTFQ